MEAVPASPSTEWGEFQMGEGGADGNSPALVPQSHPCRFLSLVTRFFHRDLECGDSIPGLPCTQWRGAQVDPSVGGGVLTLQS